MTPVKGTEGEFSRTLFRPGRTGLKAFQIPTNITSGWKDLFYRLRFVSGHDFSRAVRRNKIAGFSRCLYERKEKAKRSG